MDKTVLSGNEAIARGAYEAGVAVGTAYPGTPSTEILENLARYPEVDCNWSANEKVALEVAIGASIEGARAVACMKHVGVNVAADPLLTLSYTGVRGGVVLVCADDPGMHSSQNEQDNRHYARMAKIPLLEPSDSQEARDFTAYAFELSERYDTPVMVRSTTRISHSRGIVSPAAPQRITVPKKDYQKDAPKFVMLPGYARMRHPLVEERIERLTEEAENNPLNRLEKGSSKLGVLCSGVAYQYVKEALPEATILKLGLSHPFPLKLAKELSDSVEELLVVEELDPFFEEQLRAAGIKVKGKELFPATGELSVEIIREKVLNEKRETIAVPGDLPPRPPVMCPGCSHRAVFYTLKRLKLEVMGDIGCYTLGALAPLERIDSCICMGASVGTALGREKANAGAASHTVAVIGDSTFYHSGITPLLDIVYSKSAATVIILDNRTTAMTGHQDHPGTGTTLQGEEITPVDLEALCRAVGVKRVTTVNPFEMKKLQEIIKEEVAAEEASVVIARRPCILLSRDIHPPLEVDADKCNGCENCIQLGCPALSLVNDKARIDSAVCNGCDLCLQVCRRDAIYRPGEQTSPTEEGDKK